MNLRLASFNICRAKFSSIEKVCQFISNLKADILFIQEIDRFMERSSNIDQFEVIKKQCGFSFAHFNHTLSFGETGHYGTAVFLKANVLGKVTTIDLTINDDPEPRRCINLQLNNDTNLLMVHLSKFEEIACKQLENLIASKNFTDKSILLGDFNITSKVLEQKFQMNENDATLTWPNSNPNKRIDHILSRDIAINSPQTINALGISDHHAITAEISVL